MAVGPSPSIRVQFLLLGISIVLIFYLPRFSETQLNQLLSAVEWILNWLNPSLLRPRVSVEWFNEQLDSLSIILQKDVVLLGIAIFICSLGANLIETRWYARH